MNDRCPYICNNKTENGYCKTTGCINPKIIKDIFYDGYAYCLIDFGKDTVLCKDCKHYKQSAVADRKMCFRKDVDGIEVCYDFLPYDSCTYGERKDEVED